MSFTPGVVLVLEATDSYLRKTPSVKRLVFKSVSDVSTRLVMLKRGDVDGAYGLSGEPTASPARSARKSGAPPGSRCGQLRSRDPLPALRRSP